MERTESSFVTKTWQAMKVVQAASNSVDAGSHSGHTIKFEFEQSSREPHNVSSADTDHSDTEKLDHLLIRKQELLGDRPVSQIVIHRCQDVRGDW